MSKLEYSKEDIIEMQDDITWWTNRFKAVERDNRELKQRIDKAIEYIKKFQFIDEIREMDIKEYVKLLEILGDKE